MAKRDPATAPRVTMPATPTSTQENPPQPTPGRSGCLVIAFVLAILGGWLLWPAIRPANADANLRAVPAIIVEVREERSRSTVAEEEQESLLVIAKVRFSWDGKERQAQVAGSRYRTLGGRGTSSAPLAVPATNDTVELLVDRSDPGRCWLPQIGDHPPASKPAAGNFLWLLLGGILLLGGLLGLAASLLPAATKTPQSPN